VVYAPVLYEKYKKKEKEKNDPDNVMKFMDKLKFMAEIFYQDFLFFAFLWRRNAYHL